MFFFFISEDSQVHKAVSTEGPLVVEFLTVSHKLYQQVKYYPVTVELNVFLFLRWALLGLLLHLGFNV